MTTEQNLAAESDDERDDLTVIEGLGETSADALYEAGIQRFAQLARFRTPAELHQFLLERGVDIPVARIENKSGKKGMGTWLQQARKMVQEPGSEHGPPETETDNAEAMQETGEAANQPHEAESEHGSPETDTAEALQEAVEALDQRNWIPEAGFSVIFDYVVNENGEQDWQTRVRYTRDFDPKSDYKVFPGIDPSPWVKWILERAGLPTLAVSEATEEPALVAHEVPAPTEKTKIEIVDLQVTETGPSSSVPNRGLMAQVSFKLSGPDVEQVTTKSLPFRVEIHTVDQKEGNSKLVASRKGQLQPRVLMYESEQWFPIPEAVGRYDLHCWVLLLPPGTMAAHHQGPTINRVP